MEYRRAIQEHLVANCPGLTGGVEYPFTAKADHAKPYAVLKSADTAQDDEVSLGYYQALEVWVYVEPGDFESLDALARSVREALDGVFITDAAGDSIRVRWDRVAIEDWYDQELRAITTRLDFNFGQTK